MMKIKPQPMTAEELNMIHMTDIMSHKRVAFRYLSNLANLFQDEIRNCDKEHCDKKHCTKRFMKKVKILDVIADPDGYPYVRFIKCTQEIAPPDTPEMAQFIKRMTDAREQRLKERNRIKECEALPFKVRGFSPDWDKQTDCTAPTPTTSR